MKKKFFLTVILATALAITLGLSAMHPAIVCCVDVSDHSLEAIKDQSKGLYSTKVPLVPICITVDTFSDGRIYYTIHYFPFGTVGMSYAENDGYNIEKPLTGL